MPIFQGFATQPGGMQRRSKCKVIFLQALSAQEADQVLNEAIPQDSETLRDRAILEVLYSTGMRRNELINLTPEISPGQKTSLCARRLT